MTVSRLSTRRTVSREANRRGLLVGVLSRGQPTNLAEVKVAAADSADGSDPFHNCSVPPRWCRLFKRVFIKAVLCAAHTEKRVTTR